MDLPQIGLVDDGTMNVMTFGPHRDKARLLITKGLLTNLEPKELEAIVAHELAHAHDKDMGRMTNAQLFPFFLNSFYLNLVGVPESAGKVGDSKIPGKIQYVLGFLFYMLAFVSHSYILWYSRGRELHADRFAGETVDSPEAMASALIKVHFGIGGVNRPPKVVMWCQACQTTLMPEQIYQNLCRTCDRPVIKKELKRDQRSPSLDAIGAFGIADPLMAKAFSASTFHKLKVGDHYQKQVDMNAIEDWMKWELGNPWARFYEWLSPHPLLSRRLTYLAEQAEKMKHPPMVKGGFIKSR